MIKHNIYRMKRICYYQWPLTLDTLVRSGPYRASLRSPVRQFENSMTSYRVLQLNNALHPVYKGWLWGSLLASRLPFIFCVFLGQKASNFVKKWMLPMFEKPLKFKGLTVNLILGHFQQCSHFQIFYFFLELILMDSSYILWNKFQDYQLRLILR